MNVFAKFGEIPSRTLQDIKETKRFGHTFVRSFGRTDNDGQRENSIPSHKLCLWEGGIIKIHPSFNTFSHYLQVIKDRIKTTKKQWRHHFPHYKSMGVFFYFFKGR